MQDEYREGHSTLVRWNISNENAVDLGGNDPREVLEGPLRGHHLPQCRPDSHDRPQSVADPDLAGRRARDPSPLVRGWDPCGPPPGRDRFFHEAAGVDLDQRVPPDPDRYPSRVPRVLHVLDRGARGAGAFMGRPRLSPAYDPLVGAKGAPGLDRSALPPE